ncbi:MAG: RagB/SusD family nutrient uptake outer membrane protein [Bacteroidetes bacterium]|nr:MAG: RagB/SusD family nutrient uptake outer membrane protein [Bacteroidota bacterium]
MKTYQKHILVLLLVLAGTASCNKDRLNVEPVNEFLSSNFYITEDQVFSALIAAYDPVGWSMAYGQWISYVMFGEIRSDNANAGGDPSNNDQPGWQEFDDFLNTNTNVVTQPIYRRNYIGIFRANLVIENAQVSSPVVDRYQAEARFLRAYYHFELFKHFGPIPVVTTALTPDDIDLRRSTMSEVFQAIVSDLEAAIPVLPASLSADEAGRASKGAALAMLGKAYLYWADMDQDDPAKFDLAAQYLKQVVQLGVYELEDDFQDLFKLGQKNPKESVFEVQHNNLYTSDWGWFEGIDGNGIVQLCGIRGLCGAHPDYQEGWGFMLPTQGLYNHFLADDTYRQDVAITSVPELTQDILNAGGSCSPVVDITQGNPTDFVGFWQEKYANFKGYIGNNVNGGDPNLTKDANTYVIRYADVLLMLAEALHRGSGTDAEAMGYIDQVRERAAGPGDNTGNFKTTQTLMSEQGWSLQDVIWYERRAELAGEGDRWYDLVRSGRAAKSLFAGDPIRENNFDDKHLWLPISLEETTVARNLTEYPDPSLFQ